MIYDCIIIGAGPAGLVAAIYLKRFRRNILILDNHSSRASLIKKSHNYPGYSAGISGNNILQNLKKQLQTYGKSIKSISATGAFYDKKAKDFIVSTQKGQFRCKKLIMATGVHDIEPALPNLKNAIKRGLIRHCPICDGFEAIDHKIAVIGKGQKGINEAFFMATYSNDITYIPLDAKLALNKKNKLKLRKENIKIMKTPIEKITIKNKKICAVRDENQKIHNFDFVYSALGCVVRSEIAIKMGARHTKDHLLIVNKKQETNINGLYAVGDVVASLNQITVAMAEGAIAAVDIHNKLRRSKLNILINNS